jgi:hypothetical protein
MNDLAAQVPRVRTGVSRRTSSLGPVGSPPDALIRPAQAGDDESDF